MNFMLFEVGSNQARLCLDIRALLIESYSANSEVTSGSSKVKDPV